MILLVDLIEKKKTSKFWAFLVYHNIVTSNPSIRIEQRNCWNVVCYFKLIAHRLIDSMSININRLNASIAFWFFHWTFKLITYFIYYMLKIACPKINGDQSVGKCPAYFRKLIGPDFRLLFFCVSAFLLCVSPIQLTSRPFKIIIFVVTFCVFIFSRFFFLFSSVTLWCDVAWCGLHQMFTLSVRLFLMFNGSYSLSLSAHKLFFLLC